MLRSRLLNKFLKTKTEESKQLYHKQRNVCVKTKEITLLNSFT